MLNKTNYLEQAKVAVDAAEESELAGNEGNAILHISMATSCALIAIAEELNELNVRLEAAAMDASPPPNRW